MSTKVWLVLGGAGVTCASAAGGYYVFSSKELTIEEEFSNRRFIPLDNGDQWIEEFKSDKENIKKSIGELKDATDENGGTQLRDWCQRQMKLNAKKNLKSFELVGKYCLIRDLASQLSRNKKTLLTDTSLASDWTSTYQKRKDKNTDRAGVGLSEQWTNAQQDADLTKIKGWCSDTSKGDFLASDKEKYTNLLKWCTKEGAQEE
ncbi:hypothetical protein MHC_04550 [Mycoplasma haemocanis str. Illinois]|uniref:Uncharacterized protein n=1 Tax=Mycoplasma haemocanis (strain Illinois) TaxID=1111676 RepID=H6N7Z4_MYCHN|nr:hypothetical protein [Mycoplasma haemocanis]AEW45766.1 hypothetical protein MHC_04550 [Mycoplasma haemocanis str. Illinois]